MGVEDVQVTPTANFDEQLRRVADVVGALRAEGRQVREFGCPATIDGLREGLAVRVGPGANPRIVLRGDTFVELGGPGSGSCALTLWTRTASSLRDGRITLVGPDVPEAGAGCLPFGQVVLVGGAELGPDAHQAVQRAQQVADQVEGYMVRSAERSVWGRVSRDAAGRGFGLETLGRALMILLRTGLPRLEAVEVVFVTSSREDVARLEPIAAAAREVATEIVKSYWKARGYDLDCDLDCRSCHDREVCDDVRKMLAARLRRTGGGRTRRRASRSKAVSSRRG